MKGKKLIISRDEIRKQNMIIGLTLFTIFCLIVVSFLAEKSINKTTQQQTTNNEQQTSQKGETEGIANATTEETKTTKQVTYKFVKKVSYKKGKLLIDHTTVNNSSYGDRNVNLKVAAKIINSKKSKNLKGKGYLLMPNQTFSFLKTIGKPTYKKGFKDAPGWVGNQLIDDVGGGYCQNAISMYSAAKDLGLKVEGVPHLHPSQYVVPGYDYDVTVTYTGGKDVKITNTKKYPIIIKQTAKGGSVKTEILKAKKIVKVLER